MEPEQAGVRHPERNGRSTEDVVALRVDRFGFRIVTGPTLSPFARLSSTTIVQFGHLVGPERSGTRLQTEPIEAPVAGDPQQPTAERLHVVEPIQSLPRTDERVLSDISGGLGTSHHAARHVVAAIEPSVGQLAEGV